MSEAEDAAVAPRRSQRDRKLASHFVSAESQSNKRKRSQGLSEDEADSPLSEVEASDAEEQDADVEEDYTTPKRKPKVKQPSDKPPPKKRGRPPAAKKAKTVKTTTASSSKPKKPSTGKRGRKPANGANFDADQVAKDTKIANDNTLFNAIMNPSAALQTTAEDFLDSLTQTAEPSQAELINCVLRACGCNHTLNADEALDYDGVLDALDHITEALKQDDTPVYPLTSKLPAFKKFRKSLSEFLSRLISSAAALELLYTTDLLTTLQTWVVAMSSSHLRAFRHTATVVALEVETALCEVAAEVEKQAETISRQREGERKRKKGKSEPPTAREKELEAKAAVIRERRAKLAEFLKEFVDGVFVHRYRDLDPNIRAECVRAMGLWFAKYPAHFLDGTYLRYVGWVLSDANTHVRQEAVKALSLAYDQTEYIGIAALQHFTERFKPRLVEMALGDTELSVRIAVVQVLHAIDGHGLLEDDQREKLCLLVFDEEARMRKAVSAFVKGVWQETVNDRLVGKKPDAKEKKRVGVKALALLLVQWGRVLDKGIDVEDADMEDAGDLSEGSSKRGRGKEVAPLVGLMQKGRTALAVEALWDEVEPVTDWETILETLLADHSVPGDDDSSQRTGRKKGKPTSHDNPVDETWRLEEVEEGVLLEVLLASLRKTQADVKKGEEDIVSSDITRALMKALPTLFIKYQTDPGRMSDVLQLVQVMNLDMYLEMRMITAYSSLWDDVIKQFMSHSVAVVLNNAVTTMRYMLDATSLSNANSTKILELEEELSTSLRDTLKGRDELELASFDEDEVLALTAVCARLATLAGARDITSWMEEDEGGKQSSAWDIISAIAERGRLGYKEEEQMIDQALSLLTLHVMWKARGLTAATDPTPEERSYRDKLKECRDSLVDRLAEFAAGTQSNTSDGVRRAAFQNLMNLHILFNPAQADGSTLPTASLALALSEEVQARCAGFVQAEIERYAEELQDSAASDQDLSEEQDSEDQERAESSKPRKANNKKKSKQSSRTEPTGPTSRARLEREYIFMGVIATFLRAIRAGVIHFQHSAVLLTHYARLGVSFDLCAKVIVDILREEGMYKNNGDAVVAVIFESLRESFALYLDRGMGAPEQTIALGKLLAACVTIRGAQLSVVRRLDSKHVIGIHTTALSFICKKIASLNSKQKRSHALAFFKALSPLLNHIDPRDALQIKAHLDQAMAQSKITPMTTNAWDPYHAYVKRLTSSKEKGSKGRRGKKDAGRGGTTTTDEDDDIPEVQEAPKSRPRPRPRPVEKSVASGTDTERDLMDEEHNPFLQDGPVTPKRPPRPRPLSKKELSEVPPTRSPSPERSPSAVVEGSLSLSEPPMSPEPDAFVTSTVSKKRPRTPEEDESAAGESHAEDPSEVAASPEIPTADEIRIRRKRVRH